MLYVTNSPGETERAGRDFTAQILLPAMASGKTTAAVLLSGDLGAGKTRFVKGMAAALGITEPIASPTFAIVNEYTGRTTDRSVNLFHFDLYRLNSADDLEAIGFYDYLAQGGVFAVEWQERGAGIETEFDVVFCVTISKIEDESKQETREINIDYFRD
jgi:tRNA threonylcarbamoyladenosine biosynthesis protein TsaE